LTLHKGGGHVKAESGSSLFERGAAMVQRKMIPAYGGYNIAVATEQMHDGNWAAVATVTQSTSTAQRNIDLPVPKERFATEADAENFAVRMAKEWIEKNMPSEHTESL
jgi:hypothetical protein